MGKCIITRRGGDISFPWECFYGTISGNQIILPADKFSAGSHGVIFAPWSATTYIIARFDVSYNSSLGYNYVSATGYTMYSTTSATDQLGGFNYTYGTTTYNLVPRNGNGYVLGSSLYTKCILYRFPS